MKVAIYLLFAVLVVFGEARSPFQEQDSVHNKRFLGSIGSWINNNIINPVVDGINTGIDVISGGINTGIDAITGGINSVINTIADPFNSFINTMSGLPNTVVNAVNDAVDFLKEQAMNVVMLVVQPGQPGQPAQQDLCQTTCFQRINYQGQTTDYYFDRPNGCISKGFVGLDSTFNSCCDKHNQCLNSKCCTDDCQKLKNECDMEYDVCMKQLCVQFIADNNKFYSCLATGSYIASTAVNKTCSATTTSSRKLCYC